MVIVGAVGVTQFPETALTIGQAYSRRNRGCHEEGDEMKRNVGYMFIGGIRDGLYRLTCDSPSECSDEELIEGSMNDEVVVFGDGKYRPVNPEGIIWAAESLSDWDVFCRLSGMSDEDLYSTDVAWDRRRAIYLSDIERQWWMCGRCHQLRRRTRKWKLDTSGANWEPVCTRCVIRLQAYPTWGFAGPSDAASNVYCAGLSVVEVRQVLRQRELGGYLHW